MNATTAPDPLGAGDPYDELARTIAVRYDRLLASLRVLGVNCTAMLEPLFGRGVIGPLDHGDLVRMRDLSYMVLDAHPEVYGSGVVFDVDRLAAVDQTIQWYVRGPNGYEPYGFVYDERSSEFYDYMRLPWYSVPKTENRPMLAGPYLDFLGVDEYIITVASPVLIGGRFGGTAAADLEVRHVERRFLELVRGIDAEVAMTNLEGRIICSNSSRALPGDRADEREASRIIDVPTEVPMMRLFIRPRQG